MFSFLPLIEYVYRTQDKKINVGASTFFSRKEINSLIFSGVIILVSVAYVGRFYMHKYMSLNVCMCI